MKNKFGKYVVLVMTVVMGMMLAGGCAPIRVTEQYQKYNRIYVGWMDLGEKNYAAYGYGTKSEWEQEIKSQNIDSLQAYTRSYMKRWNVIGADSKTSVITRDPNTLVIKFTHVVLTPGTAQLTCTMSFYDGGTGKLLKTVHEAPSSVDYNPWGGYSNWSFSGKLSNSMYGVAYDIKYNLTTD